MIKCVIELAKERKRIADEREAEIKAKELAAIEAQKQRYLFLNTIK